MNDAVRVHVLDTLAYLLDELDAVFLRESEIVGHHSLEELATGNTG